MSFLLSIEPNSYGLRHEKSSLMIGEVPVKIKKNILDIRGRKFYLTKGLIELLTRVKPNNFNDEDILSYKQVLILTNAHKRRYGNVLRIKPSKSWKYENIISKLFPPHRKKAVGKEDATVKRLITELVHSNKEEDEEKVDTKEITPFRSVTTLKRYLDMDPHEIVDLIRTADSKGEDYQMFINILKYMNIIE